MAVTRAIASGNYSDPSIWENGIVPPSTDSVEANGNTVTIDQDVAAAELTTSSGGNFQITSGEYVIAADLRAGSTLCLDVVGLGSIAHVTGSASGGTAPSSYGSRASSSGIVNIANDSNGGVGPSSFGAYAYSSGIVNIANDSNGGAGSSSFGSYAPSLGVVNIANDSNGGAGSSSYGSRASSSGIVNIANDSNGGVGLSSFGAYAYSSGIVNIANTARASLTSPGAYNHSGNIYLNAIAYSTTGQSPTFGEIIFRKDGNTSCQLRLDDSDLILRLPDCPAEPDVRDGVTYNYQQFTGSCAVPKAPNVTLDVPVDASVGTHIDNPNILNVNQDGANAIADLVSKLNQVAENAPAAVIPAPETILQTTAYTHCYDSNAQPLAGVNCNLIIKNSSIAGKAYKAKPQAAISDSEGLVSFTIPRGTGIKVEFWSGRSNKATATGVDADLLQLPALIIP